MLHRFTDGCRNNRAKATEVSSCHSSNTREIELRAQGARCLVRFEEGKKKERRGLLAAHNENATARSSRDSEKPTRGFLRSAEPLNLPCLLLCLPVLGTCRGRHERLFGDGGLPEEPVEVAARAVRPGMPPVAAATVGRERHGAVRAVRRREEKRRCEQRKRKRGCEQRKRREDANNGREEKVRTTVGNAAYGLHAVVMARPVVYTCNSGIGSVSILSYKHSGCSTAAVQRAVCADT